MANELMHYGVKGMKWGVQKKDRSGSNGYPKNSPKKVSMRKVHLEAKGLKKGKTQEEATLSAEKRMRVEKALKIAGGVAVGAAVAYVAARELDKRFSSVDLPVNTVLRNVNALGENQNYDRRLYTTFEQADSKKYRGIMARHLTDQAVKMRAAKMSGISDAVYESSMTAKKRIKAPSHMEAKKLYAEFEKDFKYGTGARSYKEFNKGLVGDSSINRKFYKFMESKGYNAILDANDQFISGFDAKKPLILFNAASSTTKLADRVINKPEITKEYNGFMAGRITKAAIKNVTIGAMVLGAFGTANNAAKNEAITKYLDEHPNSEKTYAEVYNMLEKDKSGLYTVKE